VSGELGLIEPTIKRYILGEFLDGQDSEELTETTPLITTGILDSIAVLRLVMYLESEFSVTIDPQESTAEQLDTIEKIAKLIQSKNA
jgi:acyl carrier protein